MTTIREAVRTVLITDVTLMALATGGVHDDDSLDNRNGLTPEALQAADSPIIRPGVYIRWTTSDPFGLNDATLNAERAFFEVYFYQHEGYDVITAMRDRVKRLLHQQRVNYDTPANQYCYAIIWAGDVLTMKDREMAGASMERTRYEVHLRRKDY
jgi:hypothetical protein